MSERLKACFDSPEPSDDLRRRVRALPSPKKGIPPPMQLKIFGGVATAVVLCGFCAVRTWPIVRQRTIPAPQTALLQPLTNTVGERLFTVYDYGWNAYGEFYLLYTAGKLPKDAWITNSQGKSIYQDTPTTTQDWILSALTSDQHMYTLEDGEIPSQVIFPLPMHLPVGSAIGTVPPQRVAPDGCKYEAALFKFRKKPTTSSLECILTFTAPRRNYHSPELLSIAQNIAQRQRDSGGNWPTLKLRLGRGSSTQRETERVPARWEQYGINVTEAVRQLEERDRLR